MIKFLFYIILMNSFQVKSYSHTFEDHWFHVGACPAGWDDITSGNYMAGTCGSCDEDSYCKQTHKIEFGGDETRPKNMRVVYIMKIK